MREVASTNAMTIVPYEALDKKTLRNLVVEFIGREGTDYGEHEVAFDVKVEQVIRKLQTGEALITYCVKTETTSIVSANSLRDIDMST